jgi:hypothetical protein
MRDAIRPDEPRHITTGEPAPAPPSHHLDMPDLRLPESRCDRASIVVVYGLAFFAPITFSMDNGVGFFLFLWGLFGTVVYPFQFWKAPAAGYLVVCWLANPLFWIGLSLLGCRQRSRRLLGGVCGACAVLAALVWFLPWNPLTKVKVLVGPAYLLWCGSFVLLAVEALQSCRLRAGGEVRHLQRDLAAHPSILSQVDSPHAAGAQLLEDAITVEDRRQFLVRGHGDPFDKS